MSRIAAALAIILVSCNTIPESEQQNNTTAKTPVTVTTVSYGSISESITLNATSAYLKKNVVKANMAGYIERSYANIGLMVHNGSTLFKVNTKESAALVHYSKSDSLFSKARSLVIRVPSSGIITEVSRHENDYFVEGDPLCTIADLSSFAFLLSLPYEQTGVVKVGTSCIVQLPDSTKITGTITANLVSVDPTSQTQSYIIKPRVQAHPLPENLQATVKIPLRSKSNAQLVEKQCVLSDETMTNFWVMKLINDTTAIKVPIRKGITSDTQVEIIFPQFTKSDRIIRTGSYGLADTASIRVVKK